MKALSRITVLFTMVSLCRGAALVHENGYRGLVELANERTRVVLDPHLGGRILKYSFDGINALHEDPRQDGWVYLGREEHEPCGGRFDIGPEAITPQRDTLWLGRWRAEITGLRSARLISEPCPDTGVQLIRAFELAAKSSHLKCTQIIKNVTSEAKRYSQRSRTLAAAGGICLVPLNPVSRFPRGYIVYGPDDSLALRPADEPNVRVRAGILEIVAAPTEPKFAVDSQEEWLAYLTRSGRLFLKRFPIDLRTGNGEIVGNAVSVTYQENGACELESIGSWDWIYPGKSVSYTEHWWLFDYPYPADRIPDLQKIQDLIGGARR